jgi:hypothetical protein
VRLAAPGTPARVYRTFRGNRGDARGVLWIATFCFLDPPRGTPVGHGGRILIS